MKIGIECEGMDIDEAGLVEQLWPSAADDPFDDVCEIPERATEVKTKNSADASQLRHGGETTSGKDIPPGKKKKQADGAGWDKRPFAVADFRHSTEEHEQVGSISSIRS